MAALVAVAAAIDLGDLYWIGFTVERLAVIVAAGAGLGAAVALRRTRPVAALAVAGLGYLAAWVASASLHEAWLLPAMAQSAVWVVVFSHIAEGTSRMRLVSLAVLSACTALEAIQDIWLLDQDGAGPTGLFFSAMTYTLVPLVLCAAADAVRGRVQLATAQAEQAERMRELDTQAAAHDERLRIARELHDVVANRLSAVTMRITAAGHVRRLPATAESKVLDEIGKELDTALDELRSMLGALRGARDGADNTAPPSLRNAKELADLARRTGARVDFVVHGTPVPLPSMVDLTAYRILQEALANVTRHARPPHATVTIDYRQEGVHLRVDDDGTHTAPPSPPPSRSGHGIIGMRERAALCGGRATAGIRQGGGWTVEATLPLPAPRTP
ncbi:sensor histidine kinase [Streptomyces sp. PCS3-D2]|uniref:sensor histidine kinase n=1 Tax=Streptomyces sp. PCS3-D2 TaxID=1460244 RepID=UPI0004493204|nr:sensor histidine kinase [Streptomyces sp. PCS3-D2]WKV70070.1 sensor histidine kinase [Streptomyces sp. PCS3-D2]